MNRRTAALVIAVLVLLAVLLLLLARGGDETTAPATETVEVGTPVEGGEPGDVERVEARLFFPDEYGLLSAEPRRVPTWTSAEQGARILLEAVLAGPVEPGLNAPLPPEVTLGPVHLTAEGVLYIDLVSTQLARPPSTGSQVERLSIWSLIDTVVLGIPEVEAVVLLWNSRQLSNFGGHVDTSLPLPADRDLIRTRR